MRTQDYKLMERLYYTLVTMEEMGVLSSELSSGGYDECITVEDFIESLENELSHYE